MTKYIDWGNVGVPQTWVDTRVGISFPMGPIPILLTAVLEEMHVGLRLPGGVKTVYIQHDLWKRLRRGPLGEYRRTIRATSQGWTIDGIPVKITKGKDPYYIMTSDGRLQ